MERQDAAKFARKHLERAVNDAKTSDQHANIGLAYALLAVAEEMHRRTELEVRRDKGDYSIVQRP